MEQKKGWKKNRFAGLLAALFCIVAFNSILIIKDKGQNHNLYASADIANPFTLFDDNNPSTLKYTLPLSRKGEANVWVASVRNNKNTGTQMQYRDVQEPIFVQPNDMIVQVAADDVELSLSNEQKDKVKTTVDATKKVLGNMQWKEVETQIAEVLNDNEKAVAKNEFLTELNKSVNWKNIEQNMKAQYQTMDWQRIDTKMNNALVALELDSLQKNYTIVLNQLNKLTKGMKEKEALTVCPLPDQSIEQIEKTKEEISSRVNTIKAMRSTKKVVRL